jgi:hypothetical protein
LLEQLVSSCLSQRQASVGPSLACCGASSAHARYATLLALTTLYMWHTIRVLFS